jgi:hypothetical protein
MDLVSDFNLDSSTSAVFKLPSHEQWHVQMDPEPSASIGTPFVFGSLAGDVIEIDAFTIFAISALFLISEALFSKKRARDGESQGEAPAERPSL